jgi:hypothetical protein
VNFTFAQRSFTHPKLHIKILLCAAALTSSQL